MVRENMLHRVRTALGRGAGELPPAPPEPRIRVPEVDMETRLAMFAARLEALAGTTARAATPEEAGRMVAEQIAGRTAVASAAPFLAECGITALDGVRAGLEGADLRACCATADFGISSADYALADTGSLVMLASPCEARLISLLPPFHIAVVPRDRMLTGLDELFSILPDPSAVTSSMVLITGPSRTADIEQILVRGVHGPGNLTVVLVG
jgi:L-lactate dehydrogenase complex protein LldG